MALNIPMPSYPQPGGRGLEVANAFSDFAMKNLIGQQNLKHLQQQNELYPEQAKAQLNKLNFKLQNPFVGEPGIIGKLATQIALKNNPDLAKGFDVNKLNQTIQNDIEQSLSGQAGRTELNVKKAQGLEFNSLPAEYKTQILAQGGGMGIDPVTMQKEIMSGKSVEQIAREKGFDPNNLPDPIYPLTTAGREQIRRRNDALSEINVLGKHVNEAMAPYAKRIAGYSPKEVWRSLRGTNDDEQAKFYAARALQPELAAIRLRMAGGNVGIEAIRELTNTSLGHVKIYEPGMSEKVFSKTMDYVDEWLNEAAQAANKQSLRTKATTNSKSNVKRLIYNPQTGMLEPR